MIHRYGHLIGFLFWNVKLKIGVCKYRGNYYSICFGRMLVYKNDGLYLFESRNDFSLNLPFKIEHVCFGDEFYDIIGLFKFSNECIFNIVIRCYDDELFRYYLFGLNWCFKDKQEFVV